MFKSKRISLLTILALLIPTSAGFAGVGISAATAEETVVLSNDVTATIVIDGVERQNGDTVFLDPLTTSVVVAVTPSHANASTVVSGNTNLVVGQNTLSVTVTAEDQVTSATYNFTLEVARNQDANVNDIKINGVSYNDGDTVELPYGTTSVETAVTLSDINASYIVTGGTGLLQGSQELTIRVTAADGTTVSIFGVTLNVADPFVTLSNFKFNGTDVVVDSTVHTFSESNTLTLEATDTRAAIVVSGAAYDSTTGALALEPGVNEITINVTGHDGQTTADYVFTVLKATFTIEYQGKYEGSTSPITVTNGSSVTVAAKTTEIAVDVSGFEATTVEIEGDKDLNLGVNQVYVEVTTAEGYVVLTSFTVTVPKVTTVLTNFMVNDQDVVLNGTTATLTLEEGTTSAEVTVEAFDEESTYVITGDTGLVLGNNRLVVAVTSSDGDLVTYTVTLIVPASINAAYEKISVNGVAFNNEELLEVDSGVVDIQVDTEQVNATVAVTGAKTAESIGGNVSITNGVITASGFVTLTVVVTAQDGITKSEPVEINLLASTDLGMFNGSNLADDEIRVGTYAKINEATTKSNFAPNAKLLYKWTVDGIADTTSNTTRLLLRPDHVDTEIRAVVTSGANATLKTIIGKTFVVALGIIKKAPTPTVLGKSAIGLNLKAITKSWSEGVETSYKWYVNYEDSESEAVGTDDEFLLNADLTVGDIITLGVVGTLDGYETVEKFSAPLTVTIGSMKFTTKPTLAADPGFITGATITANPGETNVEDAEATFEWSRNGVVIADATDAEYTLVGADFNKKISVKVTYALDGYTSASLTVKSPTIKVATLEEVGAPSITKTGNVLTAVDGFSTDAPATSVQYIWYRNGRAVTDVKTRTYTLKSKDVRGTKFTVRVVGNYLGYVSTSVLSDIEDPFIVGVTPDVVPPVVPAN